MKNLKKTRILVWYELLNRMGYDNELETYKKGKRVYPSSSNKSDASRKLVRIEKE